MSLSAIVHAAVQVVAETEHHGEPAIHPYAIGAITLGILLAMLFALIAFGGGRDHS